MRTSGISTSGLETPRGTSLREREDGLLELLLNEPVGSGSMKGRALSPNALAAVVDFRCERCPVLKRASSADDGTWFTLNYCLEGRCEVSIPGAGFAVVAAGDFCVSSSRAIPDEYRYPLGRYRGVEAIVRTDLEDEPAFSLLAEAGVSLGRLCQNAGFAAVLPNDAGLSGLMVKLGDALAAQDAARAKYALLGVLVELGRRDLSTAKPRFLVTRAQARMARSAHDEVEADLGVPHDAREMAARFGVSAATLNGCFSKVYGQTVAAYARRRRMEEGARLLEEGATVAEAAVRVGYANPSKFAAAFKRELGASPSEHRLAARLDAGGGKTRPPA